MAVCRIARMPGGGAEDYERVTGLLRERGAPVLDEPPPGMILHTALTTPDGLLIIEVWKSKDRVESVYGPLRPYLVEAGVSLPEVTEYECHDLLNLLASGTVLHSHVA